MLIKGREMAASDVENALDSSVQSRRALIGSCIGMFLNPSPLVLLSFGVYLLPIVKDTGWPRDFVASAIGFAMLLIGLSPPLVGYLINRFGPHRMSSISFPLCGLAIMLLATPTTPTQFVLALALFGLLASGQTSVLYIYMLSGWFDKRRGMAMGLALACTGLGIALVPPVSALLIASLGWRGAYVALGTVVFLIGIPTSRWLLLDPPAVAAQDRTAVPGITWRDALKLRVFWMLFASILLVGAATSAGAINLNLLLIERDVEPTQASFILTVVGISMIVARLVFGTLFDRVRSQTLASLICAMVGLAFVVLASSTSVTAVMIAAVLIGIGFGAEGDALSYMSSRAFGMRDFGTIFGFIFLAFTGGGALGPMLFAAMHARFGNYDIALWVAAALCAAATLCMLLIRDEDLPFAPKRKAALDGGGGEGAEAVKA